MPAAAKKTATTGTNSKIEAEYRARTKRSLERYKEACTVLPAGLTHDSRQLLPYPLYVTHAKGPRKWDVDGHEYVDYFGGHGALMLGHCHPAMVEAVTRQVALGTHLGACHDLEVQWAKLINRMVPSAEEVRFTASGTEASHLGIRLARAFTGKRKVMRFLGHFHGWHDQVAAGSNSHFDGSVPAGLLPQIVEDTLLMSVDNLDHVVDTLEKRDDIAAVIFEAAGASSGQVPLPKGFHKAIREVTKKRGVVMIMDEVVTGFRWSKGGVQRRVGVTPDMTVLAKIVAGGLPGGAIVGRRDILDQLDPAAAAKASREKIAHQGTYNANPLCAAAGIAMLSIIDKEDVCEKAEATAHEIRAGMRQILVEEGVPWGVYGESSYLMVFQNPGGVALDPMSFDAAKLGFKGLKGAKNPGLGHRLRIAMIANGVDFNGAPGGLVSAVHGRKEVADTLEAFRTAVRWMKAEGDVK